MEDIRKKMFQDNFVPQPLGRFRPSRGIVSEDLGRTEFKTSSATNVRKSVKRPRNKVCERAENVDDASSEDDLNVISPNRPTLPLTTYSKSKAPKECQPSAEAHASPSNSRTKVKPRPNFQGVKPLDTKGKNKANPASLPANPQWTGDNMPPSNQLALRQSHNSRTDCHGTSPLEELNPNQAKRPNNTKAIRQPQPFPMQDDCLATKPEVKSEVSAPFLMHSASLVCSPPKPLPSGALKLSLPEIQQRRRKERTVPRVPQPFPLDDTSPHTFHGSLGHNDDERDELALTDDDDNTVLTYGGLRPFPMSTSQLLPETTDGASVSKRCADDGNEQRSSKRTRPSPEPNTFDDFSSLSLGDKGDISADPTSICSYCDEPWPSAPSPILISLLERTKRKSYADPRPGNALGLKAPLAVFVELCQRHRFEMTHLPLALERGWPTRLDFAGLPDRIRGLKKKLGRFIKHPIESQFWRDIRDDVKEVGRTKVVSVSGQYATFERSQPGYYGEQGSIIIHQTLYSLFPPYDIPLISVDPLTPDQFLTCVLVPETAVFLIQEDMHLSTKEEAICVVDESRKYGLAMFPEHAQGEEVAEIGEQLAKERAKERRRALERRGEADADIKRQVDLERQLARKVTGMNEYHSDAERKKMVKELVSDAESRRSMRKANPIAKAPHSNMPPIKSKVKRSDECQDVPILDGSGKLTPRPSNRKRTRESSNLPWRSKRSPSTSPITYADSKSLSQSSALKNSSRKPKPPPSRPLSQRSDQDLKWVFNLRSISPSPDPEDMEFDEVTTSDTKATYSAKSDSDVALMDNDVTPKAKPKPKLCKNVQKSVLSDSSDSDVTNKKATPKLTTTHRQVAEKGEYQGNVALGQTKRMKGMTKEKL